jgi:hypothetical protein
MPSLLSDYGHADVQVVEAVGDLCEAACDLGGSTPRLGEPLIKDPEALRTEPFDLDGSPELRVDIAIIDEAQVLLENLEVDRKHPALVANIPGTRIMCDSRSSSRARISGPLRTRPFSRLRMFPEPALTKPRLGTARCAPICELQHAFRER